MLAGGWTIVRLSLHVLAATIWVGGQLTLAGLVPALRSDNPSAVPVAARAFAGLAWPAYAVLLLTGIWNLLAVDPSDQSDAWQVTLWVKIGVVALSGFAAWMHQRSRSVPALAIWGALAGISAPAAVVLGVALAG